MATVCTVCARVPGMWTVWCGYGLYSLFRECLVNGVFGVATFCAVCAGSVWCVQWLAWLRSLQFVCKCLMCGLFGMATFFTVCARVSGLWTVWTGYGLYSLCASV